MYVYVAMLNEKLQMDVGRPSSLIPTGKVSFLQDRKYQIFVCYNKWIINGKMEYR